MFTVCPACRRMQRTRLDGRLGCDNPHCPRGEPAAFRRRVKRRAEIGAINLAAVQRAVAAQDDAP